MGNKGYPNLERRGFPRAKCNIFIFGRLGINPDEEFKAFTQNISAGGLMFETEKNIFEKGIVSRLEIYQPTGKNERVIFSIPVWAKVIWKEEKEDFKEGENRYRVGMEFLEIKEEDREMIAECIEENLAKK